MGTYDFYEMCASLAFFAYAVAGLFALGLVSEALTLFSLATVPGFV